MNTIVYKFGGSYLKDNKNYTKIYRLINRRLKKYRIVIVVTLGKIRQGTPAWKFSEIIWEVFIC